LPAFLTDFCLSAVVWEQHRNKGGLEFPLSFGITCDIILNTAYWFWEPQSDVSPASDQSFSKHLGLLHCFINLFASLTLQILFA
jgi:hypothetical protein